MDTRYIVIAAVIVLGVLALLAYRPAEQTRGPVDRPRATDRIVELPAAPADVPIATVELEAPPPEAEQPAGAAADAGMIRRFEAEHTDAAWAPIARERIVAVIGPEVEPLGGHVDTVECRQSVCRVVLTFDDAGRRPEAVAAVTAALSDARFMSLLERVQDRRVSLLVSP